MRELDHDSLFGLFDNALPECVVADVMELIEANESMIRRLTGMLCDATGAEALGEAQGDGRRKSGCGASGGEVDPSRGDRDSSRCGTSRTDDQVMGRLSDRLMIAADSFAASRKRRSAPALPSEKWIAAYLALMRRRREYVGDDLIADPCWEMLVDLCIAEQRGDRISTSSLCIASSAPPTTALRWIGVMVERGLLVRKEDKLDRRRVHLELSQTARSAMARYFAEYRQPLDL